MIPDCNRGLVHRIFPLNHGSSEMKSIFIGLPSFENSSDRLKLTVGLNEFKDSSEASADLPERSCVNNRQIVSRYDIYCATLSIVQT
jgi:hypothetical protein